MPLTRKQPSLVEIMRTFDRRLRRLETRKILGNATISGIGKALRIKGGANLEIDDGGDINVNDGGEVNVVGGLIVAYAADGNTPIVVLGTSPFDATLKGFETYRSDGSLMLIAETGPAVAHGGFFGVLDRNGRIIMSDDAASGHGLATPHVGAAILLSNDVTTWPKTTSGSWTEISRGFLEIQNPRVQWFIEHGCDGGVTGQVRLKLNGTQIGSTQASPGGSITGWQASDDVPSLATNIGQIAYVTLEAQILSGTGSLYARGGFISGTQSP